MSETNQVFVLYAASNGQTQAAGVLRRLHRDAPELAVTIDQISPHIGWWSDLTDAIEQSDFVIVVLTADALHDSLLRVKWRYAQQIGKCVLPILTEPDLSLEHLPAWKRTRPFYELSLDWHRLIEVLKGIPCQTQRIPFMAPNMPASYVKRDQEYNRLVKSVLDSDRSKPVVIAGQQPVIGGFGKTTLATALCYDVQIQDTFPDGILWVDLGETPDVMEELGKIYAVLTGEAPGFVDMENAIDSVARVLADKDCLMVLDSVASAGHLRPFLRGGKRCLRLVTLRDFNLIREGRRVDIHTMSMAEALQMLILRLGEDADRRYLHELVRRPGYWPIAIDLVGRTLQWWMEKHGMTLTAAMQTYLHELTEAGWTEFEDSFETLLSLVLEISLDSLEGEWERTQAIHMGMFPPGTDIGINVLATLWNRPIEQVTERVKHLDALGLVYFLERRGEVRLHGMIQHCLQEQIEDVAALHTYLIEAWSDPLALVDSYAWHWYVYHLIEAGQFRKLELLLTNFDWLQAKLNILNISEVITDFHRVQRIADDEVIAKLALYYVQGALQLSARVLAKDSRQLACQLIGRLMHIPDPLIQTMLGQARREPGFHPLIPSLTAPGGVILRVFEHPHSVTAVAITPDGQTMITGAADGTIQQWNMQTGEPAQISGRHDAWIHAIKITPDGEWALSASVDQRITAWHLRGEQSPRHFYGHKGPVTSLALLPDDARFVSVSWDQTLRIWNLKTGLLERTLDMGNARAGAVAVTPDGQYAVVSCQDYTLAVWNLDSETIEHKLTGHHGYVRAIEITPDGRWAVSGSEDGTLIVWDLISGQAEDVLTGHTLGINALAITPDGQTAISGSEDNTLKIWDLVRGVEKRTLIGHQYSVSCVALSPDGKQVVSGSIGGRVRLWDLKQSIHYGHQREVLALALHQNRIISGAGDGTLKVQEFHNSTLLSYPLDASHSQAISALVMTPDGQRFVSGDIDGALKVWNLDTGGLEHLLQDETARAVTALTLTRDGQKVVSGSADGSLAIWDITTGQLIHRLEGHTGMVRTLLATPDTLISGSGDHTVRIWNIEEGRLLHTLNGHTNRVTVLMLLDGEHVISGGGDGNLKIWNLHTGEKRHFWQAHYDWIFALAVSPDGQIISGAADGTLRIWDSSGNFIRRIDGHTGAIRTLHMVQDKLISASADATLRAWDVATGKNLATFTGESGLRCCVVDADTMRVVAGCQSGALHVLFLSQSFA